MWSLRHSGGEWDGATRGLASDLRSGNHRAVNSDGAPTGMLIGNTVGSAWKKAGGSGKWILRNKPDAVSLTRWVFRLEGDFVGGNEANRGGLGRISGRSLTGSLPPHARQISERPPGSSTAAASTLPSGANRRWRTAPGSEGIVEELVARGGIPEPHVAVVLPVARTLPSAEKSMDRTGLMRPLSELTSSPEVQSTMSTPGPPWEQASRVPSGEKLAMRGGFPWVRWKVRSSPSSGSRDRQAMALGGWAHEFSSRAEDGRHVIARHGAQPVRLSARPPRPRPPCRGRPRPAGARRGRTPCR